jgi:hypothetical protein
VKDKERYRQLLGLPTPWVVSGVSIDFDKLSVEVNVEWPRHRRATLKSPEFHRDFEPTVSNVFSDRSSLFSDKFSL